MLTKLTQSCGVVKVLVLGHRGFPALYPENTMVSFRKAIEFGADGLETDVRMSKDGVPFIFHDDNFQRLAGNQSKTCELTISEIRELRVNGEQIPTLEEFLKWFPEDKFLNLEIKEREAGKITVEMANRIYKGDVIYSSFDHELINQLKYEYPTKKFGYLFDERHKDLSFEEILTLFSQSTYSAHLPKEFGKILGERAIDLVKYLKSKGIKIILWTVDDKKFISGIEEYVDAVITNDLRMWKA